MPRPLSTTRHGAVGQERDVDAGGVAGHGLVDGVVDDLPDEVVEARRGRWSRCTCPAACGPGRGPRGPGCPWRRSRFPERLARPGRRAVQSASETRPFWGVGRRRWFAGKIPGQRGEPRCRQSTRGVSRKRSTRGRDPAPSSTPHPDLDRTQLAAAGDRRQPLTQRGLEVAQLGRPAGLVDLHHEAAVVQGDGPGVRGDLGPRRPRPSRRTPPRPPSRSGPATTARPRRGCRSAGSGSSSFTARSRSRPAVPAAMRSDRCRARASSGSGPALVSTTWPCGEVRGGGRRPGRDRARRARRRAGAGAARRCAR